MKYKLIKKYPNSPLLNTLVEKRGDRYHVISPDQYRKTIFAEFVEGYPEIWEKVEEIEKVQLKSYDFQLRTYAIVEEILPIRVQAESESQAIQMLKEKRFVATGPVRTESTDYDVTYDMIGDNPTYIIETRDRKQQILTLGNSLGDKLENVSKLLYDLGEVVFGK